MTNAETVKTKKYRIVDGAHTHATLSWVVDCKGIGRFVLYNLNNDKMRRFTNFDKALNSLYRFASGRGRVESY